MERTKAVIRQVKKIELSTKHLVDGLIAGNYHSIFKGQGIEFSDIRDYRPGDDIRAIDWKVTARFNHPYIKEFIEERDLHVYFIFDYSASGSFGSRCAKRQKAIELTATLMFSAMRNNDNVGLSIFTDRVETFIPARKGRRHVLKLISCLVTHQPRSMTTDLQQALVHASHVIRRKSVIFIVSDFLDQDFVTPLRILRNRHDVIAIRVHDRREQQIPDVGLIELEDEESGEQLLVDTSDETFRQNYQRMVRAEKRKLDALFRKHRIDTVDIESDGSYELPLKNFFRMRKRRLC
ncbi:MAG: DUF58 domain-containing protein [DPANN group archaeon]|nr:DUF58 domain-containing protein [DPANN group archaeon]